MSPVLKRLYSQYLHQVTKSIPPVGNIALYRRLVADHMLLNTEYSLLGQQIRAQLLAQHTTNPQRVLNHIKAAIYLGQILELIYSEYLNVPREVIRLQRQRLLYAEILHELNVELHLDKIEQDETNLSQKVRLHTIEINMYRLLLTRSKRALDVIATLKHSAPWYRDMMRQVDKYTAPYIPHITWFFYVPRLITNLSVLLKHMIPGTWMKTYERELPSKDRFQAQLQRRWFELANDLPWVTIGVLNCFVLTGPLAVYGIYLSIVFFIYDALVSLLRYSLEMERLYRLKNFYLDLPLDDNSNNGEDQRELLKALNEQIKFDTLRLGMHLFTTTVIAVAMFCGAPFLAGFPMIPLAGALALVIVCLINFAMLPILEHRRPQDMIEKPAEGWRQLGFFSARTSQRLQLKNEGGEEIELMESRVFSF